MTTRTLIALASFFFTITLAACSSGGGQSGNGGPPFMVDENGVSSFSSTALVASLAALPTEELNATESASLTYTREEEKLAHDVYAYLSALWGGNTRIFGNIANSEATHTEAVRQLLLRYAMPDPAANVAAGVFANATLQALYTQLVADGATSLVEALKVGAEIEEIDIADIQASVPAIDNQDIQLVYGYLLKGSRNHLRSFVRTLAQQGVTYVPLYLPQAEYDAIVASAMER